MGTVLLNRYLPNTLTETSTKTGALNIPDFAFRLSERRSYKVNRLDSRYGILGGANVLRFERQFLRRVRNTILQLLD